MPKEQLKELIKALGFVEIYSKNPYMVSFWREEAQDPRVNVYFTTMTVQIQWRDGYSEVHKDVDSVQLEELLSKV